nr:uncharacterized protein CFP56_01494 [Quercus suber]
MSSLSREEKDELARSKKKVKNVKHAGFSEEPSSCPSSPCHVSVSGEQGMSFKEKLLGEIPGAFTQAFNFGDSMEDDVESDEEVEALRQGLVAVKFSKEFKQNIRRPWARALIVKVYGRTVGLNFLQAKLLTLWKPAGRLDCVDLSHGFFLTRLSLKEDFENVLKKGPWFIGDHFLSLRPWEPNFRPDLANVSSIAVWIRLYNLPIEYYNAEALQHIGRAIGNVLRVDTFTATETRGRFARLCVQIDAEKPLVTAILIGRLEQSVSYEGIQKLCFGCGRLGHRKESCPYIIRQEPPDKEVQMEVGVEEGEGSRKHCEDNSPKAAVGPNSQENGDAQEDGHASTYGPWVVVARRKNGTKWQRSGGSPPIQRNERMGSFNGNIVREAAVRLERDRAGLAYGPAKENKRKLSPPRALDRAHFENSIQKIGKEVFKQAQPSLQRNHEANTLNKISTRVDLFQNSLKHHSVKSKKVLARLRIPQSSGLNAVGSGIVKEDGGEQLKGNEGERLDYGRIGDGEASHGAACQFQFKAAGWAEKASSNFGLGSCNQLVVEDCGGGALAEEGAQSKAVQCVSHGGSVGEEDLREVAHPHLLCRKQTIIQDGSCLQANEDFQPFGVDSGTRDQMDLEGEGEADAAY